MADCNRKDHRGTTAASGLAWDLREAGTSCSVGVSSEEPLASHLRSRGISSEEPFIHIYASWKQNTTAARGAIQIVRVSSWVPVTGRVPWK